MGPRWRRERAVHTGVGVRRIRAARLARSPAPSTWSVTDGPFCSSAICSGAASASASCWPRLKQSPPIFWPSASTASSSNCWSDASLTAPIHRASNTSSPVRAASSGAQSAQSPNGDCVTLPGPREPSGRSWTRASGEGRRLAESGFRSRPASALDDVGTDPRCGALRRIDRRRLGVGDRPRPRFPTGWRDSRGVDSVVGARPRAPSESRSGRRYFVNRFATPRC